MSILSNSVVVNQIAEASGAIIPLRGKVPAIPTWKTYQTTPPTAAQREAWFEAEDITAYGVVLGNVSGLTVIDFDTQTGYDEFRQYFPNLKTKTVKTRRGHHVYLRTPFHVHTEHINGGEIRSEGAYVVGPGSQIDVEEQSYTYTIVDDSDIKQITKYQLKAIRVNFTSEHVKMTLTTRHTQQMRVTASEDNITHLIRYYQATTQDSGSRNVALYNTARAARLAGMTMTDVQHQLIEIHVTQPPLTAHPAETAEQRRAEAKRTIASAYNGNLATEIRSESITHEQTETRGLLPNSVREACIEHNNTNQARLLEILYYEGHQPGDWLTERQMNEAAQKHHVGSKTVSENLRGAHSEIEGRRLYIKSNLPPNAGDYEKRTIRGISPRDQNLDRGRQARNWYQIPAIDYVCDLLNVVPQAADPLSAHDLRSAKAYRQGMHRELVRRLNPEWKMQRYADRLGVSRRTIQYYNTALDVLVTPVFGYVPLDWSNVDDPSFYGEPRLNDVTPGQWLQRSDGERFPAIKGIALRQLAAGETLVVCKRLPSRLQLPETALVVYPVIWRRLDLERDAYDWGGGAYDFPPLLPSPQPYITQDKIIAPDFSDAEAVPARPDDPMPPDFERTYAEVTLARIEESSLSPPEYELINTQLTLIGGIGESRAEHLYDLGIATMTQLIAAGSEQLGQVYWPGGYVTELTVQRWIDEAELLLGLRSMTVDEQHEQDRQARRTLSKDYLRLVKQCLDYIEAVHEWERDLFGGPYDQTLLRARSWLRKHLLEDASDHSIHGVRQVRAFFEIAQDVVSAYLPRIEMFLAKDDSELQRYDFGDRQTWRSLKRKIMHLQEKLIDEKWQPLL